MTSNNEPELDKVKSWTQLIVVICFLFSLSLGIFLSLQQHFVDLENKTYSLTFKDDMTTFDIGNGRLTLTAHNNQPYSHQLTFYGLIRANTNFLATDLSNQDGGIIDESKIVLEPSYIPANQVDFPTVVDLSIENSKEAGTFNGWLIMSNGQSMTSIPLKASSPMLFHIPIGWVVVGAAISIGLWEVVRYYKNLKLESEDGDLKKKLEELSGKLKESIELVEKMKPVIQNIESKSGNVEDLLKGYEKFGETIESQYPNAMAEVHSRSVFDENVVKDSPEGITADDISTSNIDQLLVFAMNLANEAERDARRAKSTIDRGIDIASIHSIAVENKVNENQVAGNIYEGFKKDIASVKNKITTARQMVRPMRVKIEEETKKQFQHQAEADVNRASAATVRNKIISATKRVSDNKQRIRLAIIDIASAGFGVAVALIGILNNAMVIGLQAIGAIEIMTLIGIGLGVGSLKEIVDRD